MGYRSDVRAAFYTKYKENFPMLKLFMDENFPEDLKGGIEPIESQRYFGFQFVNESVKWYDEYPEVIAFNRFVDLLQELSPYYEVENKDEEGHVTGVSKESAWCYEFIRVGENYEDIETDRSIEADGILYVNRSIHIDA